ncbi:MAG: hypothetical protein U1E77_20890 [Inhella sp.]
MDWMEEQPNIHELRKGPATALSIGTAAAILKNVIAGEVRLGAPGDYGSFHPTSYQLLVQSAWNTCVLNWHNSIPPEWAALESLVSLLEEQGQAVLAKAGTRQ